MPDDRSLLQLPQCPAVARDDPPARRRPEPILPLPRMRIGARGHLPRRCDNRARWHDAPEEPLPQSVREEAAEFLEIVEGEQLTLWAGALQKARRAP